MPPCAKTTTLWGEVVVLRLFEDGDDEDDDELLVLGLAHRSSIDP